jgi:ribose 5-phosphate isomerase B
MPDTDPQTREKIRGLVREVLKSVPIEADVPPVETYPKHVVVNSLQEKAAREFDRDESSKSLITEDDLRGLEPGSRVRVAHDVRFTPLARDIIAERSIHLIRKEARGPVLKASVVAVASDHGGYEYKQQIKQFLQGLGLKVIDLGTNSKEAVDYPDYAHAAAKAVGNGQADAAVIIDGAGIGSAMAANKVPGVRAAACYTEALARNSREHNGANVLTLGSGQNSLDEVKAIVKTFLTTEISEDRHKKRVEKIDSIQRQYSR